MTYSFGSYGERSFNRPEPSLLLWRQLVDLLSPLLRIDIASHLVVGLLWIVELLGQNPVPSIPQPVEVPEKDVDYFSVGELDDVVSSESEEEESGKDGVFAPIRRSSA